MTPSRRDYPQRKANRRQVLKSGVGAAMLLGAARVGSAADDRIGQGRTLRGRIKQSVCPWCFDPMPLETLCRHAAEMGIQSVELVEPKDVPRDACRDPDDLPILGTLLAAEADCLVTGDKDLLDLKEFQSVPILSPRTLHDRLS